MTIFYTGLFSGSAGGQVLCFSGTILAQIIPHILQIIDELQPFGKNRNGINPSCAFIA
jgi:hypothetical protein